MNTSLFYGDVMRLGLRHIITSLIPIFLLLILTAIISFSVWQDHQETLLIEAQNTAQITADRVDHLFYNVTRAASEFINRRNSIEDTIDVVQEGVLSNFFSAYIPGVNLNIQITSPENRVLYRSWDSLSYGDVAPLEQVGKFQPKVIKLDGAFQFAVALPVIDLKNHHLGNILVATKLDNKFLNEIKPNYTEIIQIGLDSKLLTESSKPNNDLISGKSFLKILPGFWVKIHHETQFKVGRNHYFRNLVFGIFLLLFFLSGFIIWKLTNQQIIDPVLKIHSVIIDGSDIKNIDDLPINEIGSLGRALLHQKLQIEQRNIELKNVSDELNKETSLLKVLSHDLATPMMVVKVSAGQLKKSVESGERSLILIQRIVSQVTMIESVLGHVKEMKALETGKRRLTLFELTFGPIIQDIMITFKDRLDEKNITLDWPISDEETRLVADEISFRVSVISNLLINAIKFSERGGRIELRCREVGGQTRFDMRDYGPGIPLDIREHLFSTDYETTRKGSEGEDGTGFGMSIVRFYVTLYGGSVDFVTKTKEESSTDYGTTFTIILKSRFINNLKLSA